MNDQNMIIHDHSQRSFDWSYQPSGLNAGVLVWKYRRRDWSPFWFNSVASARWWEAKIFDSKCIFAVFFFKILIFWFHLPASADIGSPLVPRSPSRLLFPILAVAFMSLFAAAYAAGVKYMPAVLAPWQPKVLGLGPKGWRQWWLNINRYILYIDIFMPQ